MRPAANSAAAVCSSDSLLELSAVVMAWVSPTRPTARIATAHITSTREKAEQTHPWNLREPKSASKLDALHTLRAKWGLPPARQRMECVQLAGALETNPFMLAEGFKVGFSGSENQESEREP